MSRPACKHEAWEQRGRARFCTEPDCREYLGEFPNKAPIGATVTPAATLPADCEGELRTLAREMREWGNISDGDALVAIIDRYSGARPMRTGKAP